MYTAQVIARWFLAHNRRLYEEEDEEFLTLQKLQKLLYYAQGANLAFYGKPLFEEAVLRWKHGPALQSVYDEYHFYARRPIEYTGAFEDEIDPLTEALLEQIYDEFGQYTARSLRNRVLEENALKNTPAGKVIENQLIKKDFEENYVG